MPLNREQFQALRSKGLSIEQIAKFEGAGSSLDTQRASIKSHGQTQAREMLDTDPMARGMAKTPGMIEERGSLYPTISENLKSPSFLRKGAGVLQAAGAPFKSVEGAVANPMIAFQRGENNPISLMKESAKGLIGTKQGEFGDLFRNVGASEPVAATIGFGLGVGVPSKIIGGVAKSLSPISKMSDKGIMKAGESLKTATKSAEKFRGTELEKQFGHLNQIPVDQNALITEASKIPANVVAHMEEELGQRIDQLAPTVENLRKVKQALGGIRNKAFGKGERGLTETLDEEKVSRAYGGLKNLLESTVKNHAGEKVAKSLMDAEEGYSKVKGAGSLVRKAITNPDLRQPTRAGRIAKGIEEEGDVSVRAALNILKNSGKESKRSIIKAVDTLKHFNRMQDVFGALKHGINAATYGGAVGAVGGMTAGKLMRRGE